MSPSALVEALELRRGDLVSLVGGGGKTTLMYRLVSELRAQGLKAAAATTTKIAPPGPEDGAALLCAATYEEARRRLELNGAAVLGREVLGAGKVRGVPPEWCDRLVSEGVVDVLVVEADGSARRPLKAPEEWEPVVPVGTTAFVALAGLSCLGEPLDEGAVFRAERASRVSGFPLGARITPEVLAAVLAAREGLLRGCPPGARAYALLNQADTEERTRAAAEVARRLLDAGCYRRVLTAALKDAASLKRVSARPAVPLEWDPLTGRLSLGGQAYLLIRPETLGGLLACRDAEVLEGVVAGARAGGRLAAGSALGSGLSGREALERLCRMGGEIGWGRLRLAEWGEARVVVEVEHSPFAEAGAGASVPACHLLAGVLSGMLERVFGRPFRGRETACAAAGGRSCRIELTP